VRNHALSITTQSRERLNFQFDPKGIEKIPVFIVQNAPSVPMNRPVLALHRSVDVERPRFVYLGHAIPLHGMFPMLELIKAWPGATLTLQGIHPEPSLRLIRKQYGALIDSGRVSINSGYLSEVELEQFLSGFDIGLCLYELDRRQCSNFNYLSSPAGKMFNYFSSGIPVLASSQIGLSPVSRRGAGIQVMSNSVAELKAAAHAILSDYQKYSAACVEAAIHYDFKTSVIRFVAFLQSGAEP
jgi:hypothetical protein